MTLNGSVTTPLYHNLNYSWHLPVET